MSKFSKIESDNIIIRDAKLEDIELISRYHKLFINGGLSNFSEEIIKLFYESCIALEDKIIRVCVVGEKVKGFYLVHIGRKFSFFIVFWQRLFDFIKLLLLSPSSIFVLIKSFFVQKKLPECKYDSEWLYLVVIPSTDKNDLAGLLFEDVIKNLEQEGVSELGGMMDSKNSFSIRFHERLGAEFVGDYMRGKDKWLLIKYSIKHV